eukprot:2753233-Amphidinium_carterae.1
MSVRASLTTSLPFRILQGDQCAIPHTEGSLGLGQLRHHVVASASDWTSLFEGARRILEMPAARAYLRFSSRGDVRE